MGNKEVAHNHSFSKEYNAMVSQFSYENKGVETKGFIHNNTISFKYKNRLNLNILLEQRACPCIKKCSKK